MVNEYIRKAEAIEAVDFGITLASAINLETGEWSELFKRENDELREAIDKSAKTVKLNIEYVTPTQKDLAVQFQRSFDELDEETANEILEILKRNA